jgi:hypothetical protein
LNVVQLRLPNGWFSVTSTGIDGEMIPHIAPTLPSS